MVRVGVTYVYESLHKRRNAGVCVCVCHGWSDIAITQHVFWNELARCPPPRAASARALSLSLRSDLHEKKKKKPSLFFLLLFPSLVTGKGSIFSFHIWS